MGIITRSMAALAALAFAGMGAGVASAATETVNFTISGGGWHELTGGDPFGISPDTNYSGSFTVNVPPLQLADQWVPTSALTGFDLTAGNKTWTLADVADRLDTVRFGDYGGTEQVEGLNIILGTPVSNYLELETSSVAIGDASGIWDCGCLTFTPMPIGPDLSAAPEPSSWALAILGLGLSGAAMRRRRAASLAV